MAWSRSRKLCQLIAAKQVGYRSGTTLALVDSASGYDTITDIGGLLVSSGMASGQRIGIYSASCANNCIESWATSVCGSTLWLANETGGVLATNQVAGSSFIVIGYDIGTFQSVMDRCQLDLYSGTRPDNADATEGSGTKLVSYTGLRWGPSSWDSSEEAAYIDLAPGLSITTTVLANGTASWGRFRRYGETTTGADTTGAYGRMDGSCGSTSELRLPVYTLTAGMPASISNIRLYFKRLVTSS